MINLIFLTGQEKLKPFSRLSPSEIHWIHSSRAEKRQAQKEKKMGGNPELLILDKLPWEPFGGKTKGIFRKSLSSMTFPSGFKASLTLAKPAGEFPEHIDPYTHIFYLLEGEGEASVEGQTIPLKKGTALTVAAGKRHGYKNSGPGDLLLITLNISEGGKKNGRN